MIHALQADPMIGPFASPDAFVDSLDPEKFDSEWVQFWGALSSPKDTTHPYKIAAPHGLDSVEIFRVRYNGDEADFYLGVETKEGWYVKEKPLAYVYSPGIMGISENFDVLALHQVCIVHCHTWGQTPELVIRFAHSRRDVSMGISEVFETEAEFLVICGVGLSRHPSCTAVVELFSSSRVEDIGLDIPGKRPEEYFEIHRNLRVAFRDDGLLEFAGDAGVPNDWNVQGKGYYELSFP